MRNRGHHGYYRRGSDPTFAIIAFWIFIFIVFALAKGILYAILLSMGFLSLIMIFTSISGRKEKEEQLKEEYQKERKRLENEKKRMNSMKIFYLNKDITVLHYSFKEAILFYNVKIGGSPHIRERDLTTGKFIYLEDYEVFTDTIGQNLETVRELIDKRRITSPQAFYLKNFINSREELLVLKKFEQGKMHSYNL